MAASAYAEIVQRNLRHMGTDPKEWTACPTEMTASGPNVTYPAGYTDAPSMIPDYSGVGSCPCLLCGHSIKNCYAIQNDSRRWVLRVGSECVTHFAGASGETIAKDAELDKAKALLGAIETVLADCWSRTPSAARKIIQIRGAGALDTPGSIRTWYRFNAGNAERVTKLLGMLDKLAVSSWSSKEREHAKSAAETIRAALAPFTKPA